MATAKKMREGATLAFEALAIEGGLLSADWLARVAQLSAGGQGETDYRIPKGLNLRDEIGRYWRIAQAHWADFDAGRRAGADPATLADRFVQALLRDSFGFTSLVAAEPVVMASRTYPVRLIALGARVPVVIAPAGVGLDSLAVAYGDGVRRRSAFGLTQEYLNAADRARWGLASDGCALRIVRDNASLTRPAWVEVDLARIFTEELYADFAALWLLAHETRFGRPDQPVDDCALETWRKAGREEGTRAREHLRRGVEDALLSLGQGFLTHPDNQALRASLQDGSLTTTAYFQQLLRLVYRLIFLLTIEERGLLHPEGSADSARSLYAEGYSIRRLRDRAVKRSAHDRFPDLWEATKIVFRALAGGESALALPALAGIFATSHCATLDGAKLENRALLLAVFRLSWLREDTGLARVNWRDMGPEELGSVYESLLELVPQITKEGRQFAFATGGETKGNARKTSGSYYTPDSLVQVLIDSALEPVIQAAISAHPADPVPAILELSVVDPACGSGHFLLAAARRLAAHVARLSSNGTPSAAEYRHALRQVVARCIYGVDLNPMAVELCKVSLWMEAVEPGLPLTFLDSHIQHGNALLGTTPELMSKGVPDEAWDPIEGDDRKIASALKKRNKAELVGQRSLIERWSGSSHDEGAEILRAVADLEASSDADAAALAMKESRWKEILGSDVYRHQKFVADAWCAAFVWPKQPGPIADLAPTHQQWRYLLDTEFRPPAVTLETVDALTAHYRFFHWHLQFPHVFARGGFEVVLGNPPWERMKVDEQEFFAARSPEIAGAPNAAARKSLIARLPESAPQLWREWSSWCRMAEGGSHFARQSGRFPLCGKGDVNTYALFAESNRLLFLSTGRAGFIVPSGIATDDGTKDFFGAIIESEQLLRFYDFQSGPGLFGDIGHARFKFALITLANGSPQSTLVFFARSTSELSDPERSVTLLSADFARFNPNTKTCPTFRTARDARITKEVYERHPILWLEEGPGRPGANAWGLTIRRQLDMNQPKTLSLCASMRDARHGLPVFEAKLVHQFDHRFGDYAAKKIGAKGTSLPEVGLASLLNPLYAVQPRYWIGDESVAERTSGTWTRRWLLVWRDICRSFDERTAIAAIVPFAGTDFTLRVGTLSDPERAPELVATFNSFAFDFVARQKLGGTHLSDYIVKQLPIPSPEAYIERGTPWSAGSPFRSWILPRVLELSYTAWALESFGRDFGYGGPPFRWNLERRFLLRCELDAACFHLYGLSCDDADYVMDTFPIVRKNDEKVHGEYRTKRVILEIYDEMAAAARIGRPYVTRLDPPPADPRVAHPDTRGDRQ